MSPSRPHLPFEQPALPVLEHHESAPETPTPTPARSRQQPALAVVKPLTPRPVPERAMDLVCALAAVGVPLDGHQALALAHAGVTGPLTWVTAEDPPARRTRASQTLAALTAEVARRRAAAARDQTGGGAS